jgi:hypothetical protein
MKISAVKIFRVFKWNNAKDFCFAFFIVYQNEDDRISFCSRTQNQFSWKTNLYTMKDFRFSQQGCWRFSSSCLGSCFDWWRVTNIRVEQLNYSVLFFNRLLWKWRQYVPSKRRWLLPVGAFQNPERLEYCINKPIIQSEAICVFTFPEVLMWQPSELSVSLVPFDLIST